MTVLPDGKPDAGTTLQAAKEIEAGIGRADQCILDMKGLKYISSSGSEFFFSLHKKMSEKDGLIIRNANGTIHEIFDFTGIAKILNFE